MRTFGALIAPYSATTFAEEYWARRPLHIARRDPGAYDDLIGLPELSAIFPSATRSRGSRSRCPRERRARPNAPPASFGDIYRGLMAGKPLRVRRMEHFLDPERPRSRSCAIWSSRSSIRSRRSRATRRRPAGPAWARTTTRPRSLRCRSRGQSGGGSDQRVDSAAPGLHERGQLPDPTYECRLEAGDLLYVPGGWVHDVACEEAAFSLTVVFAPFRWSALLEILRARLAATSDFNEAIPAGALLGNGSATELCEALERRLERIRRELATLDVATLRDLLAVEFVRRTTTPPDSVIENIFDLTSITLDTRLQRRAQIAAHLTRAGNDVVLVLSGGNTLRADARVEPALRRILESDVAGSRARLPRRSQRRCKADARAEPRDVRAPPGRLAVSESSADDRPWNAEQIALASSRRLTD